MTSPSDLPGTPLSERPELAALIDQLEASIQRYEASLDRFAEALAALGQRDGEE